MRFGAHSAYPVGDLRHFFGGSSHAEFLESAQFRDLKIGILYRPLLIQQDLDFCMTF